MLEIFLKMRKISALNLPKDQIMDIKKLFELSKRDTNASKRAAEGFKERLQEREKAFAQESRKLAPSEGFYARSYNL